MLTVLNYTVKLNEAFLRWYHYKWTVPVCVIQKKGLHKFYQLVFLQTQSNENGIFWVFDLFFWHFFLKMEDICHEAID